MGVEPYQRYNVFISLKFHKESAIDTLAEPVAMVWQAVMSLHC